MHEQGRIALCTLITLGSRFKKVSSTSQVAVFATHCWRSTEGMPGAHHTPLMWGWCPLTSVIHPKMGSRNRNSLVRSRRAILRGASGLRRSSACRRRHHGGPLQCGRASTQRLAGLNRSYSGRGRRRTRRSKSRYSAPSGSTCGRSCSRRRCSFFMRPLLGRSRQRRSYKKRPYWRWSGCRSSSRQCGT